MQAKATWRVGGGCGRVGDRGLRGKRWGAAPRIIPLLSLGVNFCGGRADPKMLLLPHEGVQRLPTHPFIIVDDMQV
jgi:hypothetical protein